MSEMQCSYVPDDGCVRPEHLNKCNVTVKDRQSHKRLQKSMGVKASLLRRTESPYSGRSEQTRASCVQVT
jgi:hypothetical protein